MSQESEKYKKLKKASINLIKLYRDGVYGRTGGFVASHRIKEWVELCEACGEPTESS